MKLWRKLFKSDDSLAEGEAADSEPVREPVREPAAVALEPSVEPVVAHVESAPPAPPAPPPPVSRTEDGTLNVLLAQLAPVEPPLPEGELESVMQGLAQFTDDRIPRLILEVLFGRGDLYRSGRFWRSAARAFRQSGHLCPVVSLAEFFNECPSHVPEWFLADLTAALGEHGTAESGALLLSLTHFTRGRGAHGGSDVRRKAVEALTRVVERHGMEISVGDLKAILSLTPPPVANWAEGPAGLESHAAPADLTGLKSLAEAELLRRQG